MTHLPQEVGYSLKEKHANLHLRVRSLLANNGIGVSCISKKLSVAKSTRTKNEKKEIDTRTQHAFLKMIIWQHCSKVCEEM